MLEDLEVREGTTIESVLQQPVEPTYVRSSSPPEYIAPSHRSPPLAHSPSSDHSPNRFDLSPTISPPVRLRGTSTTPRNTQPRTRVSASITPTAHLSRGLASTLLTAQPVDADQSDNAHEGGIIDLCDDDWGDDAVLQWDGVDLTADSASSVAPGDAGLESDDLEEEEEEWGKEAIMGFDWDGEALETGTESEEEEEEPVENRPWMRAKSEAEQEEEEEEEIEQVEERPERKDRADRSDHPSISTKEMTIESSADLQARGMPDYSTWDLKRLQRLCEGFGYRPSSNHSALEKIAIDCWRALNPLPIPIIPALAKTPMKSRPRTKVSRRDSTSSEDIPLSVKKALSDVKSKKKGKSSETIKTGTDRKGKTKSSSQVGPATREEEKGPIEKRFAAMIKGDAELYLRILQYAPIAFDELVSKCIRAGIDDKGWKLHLKKFLDFEGIAFYTEEPTGQRRRH